MKKVKITSFLEQVLLLLYLNGERKLYCSVLWLITDFLLFFFLHSSHLFLQQAFWVQKKTSRNCKFTEGCSNEIIYKELHTYFCFSNS